ncbi:MAG: choice-of-anchor D domain-containing protein, partial [Spartobacteria bacterium]|nr:choice-of-anchor D domain-containing protein [Spartobacteria bacterium]
DVISTNFYGLRLVAGGATGPGTVKWDEIRVANRWTNLFNVGRQPVWDGGDNNDNWFKPKNWMGDQLPRMDVEVTVFYETMGRSIGEANNVGRIKFNGNAGNHYPVLGLRFDYRQTNGVYIYGAGNSSVMELSHQGIEVQAGASGQTARGTNTLAFDELQLWTDQPWTSSSTNAFTFHTQISGTGNVTKSGSGRFHLVGATAKGEPNTFSGIMTISEGPLSIEQPYSLGSTSGRTVVTSSGVLELRPRAATIYTNEPLTLTGMGLTNEGALYNVAYSNRWTGPITVVDSARIGASTNSTLALAGGVNGVNGEQDLYLGGVGPIYVIDAGLGSNLRHLIKDNANTVTLSAASSWIGCTFLSNGMLRATLADATSVTTPFLVSTGGVFDLNNYHQTIGSLQDGNADPAGTGGQVWLGTANLTAGGNGSNTTWHGVISGTGGFNKKGAGTMFMAGTNTYSGPTTVSNGTLLVSGASPYSAHTTYPGGTLMGDGPVGDLAIGGTVDPGLDLGYADQFDCGPIQLVANGFLTVDMASASGTAGSEWDLLNSYGGITVQDNGTFNVKVQGNPGDFNPSLSYSWKIMAGVSPVSGFHVNKFYVDASSFFPNLDGGKFNVVQDGNDVYLTFTTGGGIPVWDGEGVDAYWNTDANWEGDLVPAVGKTVVFYTGLDSGATILLDQFRTIGGMRFTDQADTSLIFSGYQLTIGAGGIGVYADAAGEHVVASLIALQSNQTWTNDSTAAFTTAAQISGNYALRKRGVGKLVLSANNSFTGGLYVDEGGVQLNSSTNAMGTGAVQVGTNATLELNGNFYWRPVNLTLYGGGTNAGGALRQVSSGVGEWRGTITAGADARIAVAAGSFNTFNAISAGANTLYVTNYNSFTMISNQFTGTKTTGDGALHKSGPGGLFLRGSTLEGSIVVAQGPLRLVENLANAGGELRLQDGAVLTSSNGTERTVAKPVVVDGHVALGALGTYKGPLYLNGGVDLAGGVRNLAVSNLVTVNGVLANGGFAKTGPGTLTLAANNTYAGATTVEAGTLVVSGSSADSAHTVNVGGTLRGAGTVGDLSIWGLVDPADAAAAAGTLDVDGTVALNAAGTLKIDMPTAAGTAGSDWDLLEATGAVTVPASGQFIVWVTGAASGFVPGAGQSWKIVDAAAVNGFDADRFIVDTSGFAPELYAGTFSVSNDAANGDLYLVFVPSVQDPDYFGVAPNGPTSMALEFELNGAGQDVVIVYNLTGVFEAPSGAVPAVGQPFAGGTVVYSGAASPQTHLNLTSCTHYYYMLFSVYDGRYSSGLADDEETSPPPPPVVTEATLIGVDTFTANWEASTGATGYRVDVSENPYFTGGSAGAFSSFLGQGFEGGAMDNWTLTLGNAYVSDENPAGDAPTAARIRTGTYSWQRRYGSNTMQLAASSIEGFVSRTVEVHVAAISTNVSNGADGADWVGIYVALNGAEFPAEPDVKIGGSPLNNARWGYYATGVVETAAGTPVAVAAPQTGSNDNNYATARIAIPDSASSIALEIVAVNNAASEVWAIDDVAVVGASIGSSFVYEDVYVAAPATSLPVESLVEDRTYYYRVRAESSGGCISANSDTMPVVTSISVPGDPGDTLWASDGTSTNHVYVEWEDLLTETRFYVYRNTSSDAGTAQLVWTNGMSLTNWNDETAAPGQLYYYWVAGSNQNGQGVWSEPDPGFRLLNVVTNVAATEGDAINLLSNKVVVTWDDLEGETGYAIWRSLNYQTNTADCVGTVAAGTLTFDDLTAVPGWPYYYWILATNSTSESTGAWGDPAVGFRTPIGNVGEGTSLALDGREMMRAVVVPNSDNHPVLVLHSTQAPVLTYPGPSTNYSVGDVIGTAAVVYKGVASGFREHVVPPNSTNHYRIYSIQGDGEATPYPYYSDGLIPGSPLITMPYPENVYSETFSYTNKDISIGSFSNKTGGHQWTAGWSLSTAGSGHGWTVQTNGVTGLPAFKVTESNYPTVVGNRAVLEANGVGHNAARRTIATTNNGTIFVGCVVAYQYDGTGKYMTIGLMDGDTTELEFGKVYGANNLFSIRRPSDNNNAASTYEMHGWGETGRDTNDWYWMVIKYDFDDATGGKAYANCYYKGEGIPYLEPATWAAEWSGLSAISKFTSIELKGGSDNGWIGGAIWDEIRVSSIWPELIGQPGLIPYPSLVDFGEVESTLSSNLTLYIANSGGDNVPLYVDDEPAFTLTGPDAGYFTISATRFADPLFYLQSNSLTVTFWPTNSGTVPYTNAWLMVANNSGVDPYPIQLVGTGIPTVSTNVPMVSNYFVGHTRWANDAMVTSGVFAVTAEVFHVRGIYVDGALRATYNLLNGDGDVILTNEPFDAYQTADGQSYVLSDSVHAGYWPGTPSTNYQLQVTLMASNLIGHTNTLYTADGVTVANDLFFSEYVEGSSDNKALEIFNGTGADVNLSQYGIRRMMGNTTELGDYEPLPDVVLPGGGTFVIVHSSADATLRALGNWTNDTATTFNGDDTILLYKGLGAETPTDAVGSIPSGGNLYSDQTLRRLSSVTNANPAYDGLEWDSHAIDTFAGLGTHSMDGALGKVMHFTVDDDDVEAPLITDVLVGTNAPTASSPGPDILLADVPESGLTIAWNVQDVDSGLYAASNRYILRTGATVVATGYLPAGTNENGGALDGPLALSVDVPLASLPGGNYALALVGSDFDPEYEGDVMTSSNLYYFRVLAPYVEVTPAALDFGQVGVGLTSNMTVTIHNAGNMDLYVEDIEFAGTGYALFEADVDQTTIAAGESLDVTVYFTPAGGGFFNWSMIIHNDSANDPDAVVALTGNCYDPETSPPEVIEFAVMDTNAVPNVVTDHASAQGELTASFTLYQYTGMRPDGASLDLIYPDGTLAFENLPLSATVTVTNEGNLCTVFVGTPPPFWPAVLGVYTARVSAISSNGIQMIDDVYYRTLGGGVQELTETFNNVASNSASYVTAIATNADWGTWTFRATRWDQPLSGKAPTVGPLGHLISPTLTGGCTQISFDYKRAFSESGAFDYDVIVNGDVVGTVTSMPPD